MRVIPSPYAGLVLPRVRGAAVVAISKVDTLADTSDSTNYTFSGMALGAAAADRRIAVAAVSRASGNRPITGIDIAGIGGTQIVNDRNSSGGNTTNAAIFIAHVPSGTSGNIVVSHSASQLRCAITVYRLTGTAGTSPSNGFSAANNPSVSLDVPAGGAALAISYTQANTTATWSGLTKDTDDDAETTTSQYSSAHDAFASAATGLNVQCTWGSNSLVGFAAAAFSPA